MRRRLLASTALAGAIALLGPATAPFAVAAPRAASPCAPAAEGAPTLTPVVPDTVDCCGELATDERGQAILPPGATDVTYEDVDTPTGRTVDLYPAANSGLDTWYGPTSGDGCPWSIGGEVPPLGQYTDVDTQLRDAGFTSSAADLTTAMRDNATALPKEVQRPAMYDMVAQGRIPFDCVAATPVSPPSCRGSHHRVDNQHLGGHDLIFVHGLDPDAILDRVNGVPGAQTTWPADRPEFLNAGGYWKDRADQFWNDHITRELKGGNPFAVPSNRYITVAWPSTQWLAYGVHAFLYQVARAIATGAGVVPDASGDTTGFCQDGCEIVSTSAGSIIGDAAMSVASLTGTSPFNAIGNVTWIPPLVAGHVAFAPAYQGSHYATVAAALGWAATLAPALCDAVAWVLSNVFSLSLPCAQSYVIAESALTDLAVPITEAIWRPFIAATPVSVLIVADAHPSAVGIDGFAKTVSPVVKMLFHHGLDDGTVSMDSQCATNGGWLAAPQSFRVGSTFYDAAANSALLSAGLPPVVAARAYDMGIPASRALRYYADQVVGADLLIPRFWAALATGTLPAHFAASPYRVAGACVPYLSPTGMVEQVAAPHYPGSASQTRLPNHYSFLLSSSDHLTAAYGPYGTGCYETTPAPNDDETCGSAPNDEEVRAIDDAAVYAKGLARTAIQTAVYETMKGRRVSFRIGFVRFRFWLWKRYYHRLSCPGGWSPQQMAPDCVYYFGMP